ncbi:MAG: 50S ribosomal protein L5 [Candidatus Diapherotrites archaeon]|nr:50S ribosomal protein L5 [Candidatus Diapherotrites archaeon]
MAEKKENPMRRIRIEKVVVNIGVGEPGERLEKAETLLKRLTGANVVRTRAKKKIPKWGVRPGLQIGVKVTLRGEKAEEFLRKALEAVDNKIKESSFDEFGNFSFGIPEYINIPGVKYDPKIGIFGMDVSVALERPGFRVRRRKVRRAPVGKNHLITKDEAIAFVKEKFGVEVI